MRGAVTFYAGYKHPLTSNRVYSYRGRRTTPDRRNKFGPCNGPRPRGAVRTSSRGIIVGVSGSGVGRGLGGTISGLRAKINGNIGVMGRAQAGLRDSSTFRRKLGVIPSYVSTGSKRVPVGRCSFTGLEAEFVLRGSCNELRVAGGEIVFETTNHSPLNGGVFRRRFDVSRLTNIRMEYGRRFGLFGFFLKLVFSITVKNKYLTTGCRLSDTTTMSFVFTLLIFITYKVCRFCYRGGFRAGGLCAIERLLLSTTANKVVNTMSRASGDFVLIYAIVVYLTTLVGLVLVSVIRGLITVFGANTTTTVRVGERPILNLLSFLFLTGRSGCSNFTRVLP